MGDHRCDGVNKYTIFLNCCVADFLELFNVGIVVWLIDKPI